MRKVMPVGAFVFLILVLVGMLSVYLDITRPLDWGEVAALN